MSTGLKNNEYQIKVIFGGQVLRVDTVWADTESQAMRIAHNNAMADLETQRETKAETALRKELAELDALIDVENQLSEFLFDDYGDTVEQLGWAKVRELEEKLVKIQSRIRLLRLTTHLCVQ